MALEYDLCGPGLWEYGAVHLVGRGSLVARIVWAYCQLSYRYGYLRLSARRLGLERVLHKDMQLNPRQRLMSVPAMG